MCQKFRSRGKRLNFLSERLGFAEFAARISCPLSSSPGRHFLFSQTEQNPNTIEMTDKVEEHMENISLRSLFLVVIFVSGTLLSMASGDIIMKL